MGFAEVKKYILERIFQKSMGWQFHSGKSVLEVKKCISKRAFWKCFLHFGKDFSESVALCFGKDFLKDFQNHLFRMQKKNDELATCSHLRPL